MFFLNSSEFYTFRGYQQQQKNTLTASLEDYLEMICRSIKKSGHARVSELAAILNVQPSSVSKMILKLTRLGYLDYRKYGTIKLTASGVAAGEYLLWRHETMCRFFSLISPPDREPEFSQIELAEHIFSRENVARLHRLLSFFEKDESLYLEIRDFITDTAKK